MVQNIYKYKIFQILSLCVVALLIFSCQVNQGTEDDTLKPPLSVTGVLIGETIHVTWTSVDNAEHYQVYRSIGSGALVPLSGLVVGTVYIDTMFPDDNAIQYSVLSESNGIYSTLSFRSMAVSVNVLDVKTTKYEFKDRIGLTWCAIEDPELDTYVVRRYDSRSPGEDPEEVIQVSNNFYDDMNGSPDTPCFYLITWMKEEIEYGLNSIRFFGIYGKEKDNYEPNEDYYKFMDDETTTFYDWNTDDWTRAPFVYSFEDGDDGVEADTDVYKYQGSPTTISVRVKLPEDTPFTEDDCKLYFQFLHDGEYGIPQQVLPLSGINEFVFSKFDYGEQTVDLFFFVFPVVSSARSVVGKYKVEISTKFK